MTARVALFRARGDAAASASRLRRLGFSVACLPAIEIRTKPVRPQRSQYDAVVATSDKAFLTDAGHRIRFVYVPKHTSWLNQIEIWFSILVRRVIRRGNFRSAEDLREKILAFIEYFNRTLAKPFKWTFTGRPLSV